jgi:hypothetical protein
MMKNFLFTSKYVKVFNWIFSERDVKMSLDYIEKLVKQKGSNKTIIENSKIIYQGSILNRTPVYKGVFEIEIIGNDTRLTYQIVMDRTLMVIPMASIILGIVVQNIIIPIYCSIVVGAGFLVTMARYGDLFDDITDGIEKLIPLKDVVTDN